MNSPRWWDVAVVGTSLVLAAVVTLATGFAASALLGFALLVAWVLGWFALGRPAFVRERVVPMRVFTVVTIVVVGGLTAIQPELAISQAIAYPIAWALAPTTRAAIVANVGIALSVGVGFVVSIGTEPGALVQTIVTVALSFVFSLALGLWITRIAQFGDEKARLLEQLTAAQDELAVLHRDRGATGERERLARELHDTIAQSLTGLVMLAQRARRELRDGALGDETLALIEDSARAALGETRSLVAASAPVELGGGIAAALSRLAERFERETGIRVTTRIAEGSLDRDAEVVALRCAQEGLANVRKHAGARAARIELARETDATIVRVIDDGHGFDPAARRGAGFGLEGLSARLELVGGTLELDGTPGATTLTARLPHGVTS